MKNGTDDGDGSPQGLIHGDVTNHILAAAYSVHTHLGPGLLESSYKACLVHELSGAGLACEVEKLLPVKYRGIHVDLGYRLDLLVENAVVVEIKAVQSILPVHEAQLPSYLRLSGKRVGLLINFNVARLRQGIRRRIFGYGP